MFAADLLFRSIRGGLGTGGIVTIVVIIRDLELKVLCIPFSLYLTTGPSLLQPNLVREPCIKSRPGYKLEPAAQY